MGYHATTVVVLGVSLDPSRAKDLMSAIEAKLAAKGVSAQGMDLEEIVSALGYPAASQPLAWAGDGADSRISPLSMYDPGHHFEYAIGLSASEDGYVDNKEVPKALARCARPDWIQEYELGVGRMIEDLLGDSEEPEALVITQVW